MNNLCFVIIVKTQKILKHINIKRYYLEHSIIVHTFVQAKIVIYNKFGQFKIISQPYLNTFLFSVRI